MRKKITAVLLACMAVSNIALLSSCEPNEFTSMIPGLNATMELVEELTHRHKIEPVAQVDPTCHDAGTRAYYICRGCETLFADEKGETVITSPDLIERLTHAYDDEYDAECNLCGDVREAKCRHSNKETVIGKAETCTENGVTNGEKCLDCGEILVKQETIVATGHTWDGDDDENCNECGFERCFHKNTEAAGKETESTCSKQGLTAGVKCSDCGEILEEQTKKPLADHTEVADSERAPGCLTTGLTAGSHCSVCGQDIDAPETVPAAGHVWDGTECTVCGAVKFEAETSDIETNIDRLGAGMQSGKTPESTNYPSGDGYVYYLTDDGDATLTFYVTADKAGKAVLSFRAGLSNQYNASQMFTLSVNGVDCEYYASAVFPEYSSVDAIKYFGWYEIEVADVELAEGENTIVLTRNTKGLNFDYIALRSTSGATIQDTREAENGHLYTDYTVTLAPTYDAKGEAGAYCDYCRNYATVELPAVSVEAGYTKISSGVKSVWKYMLGSTELEIEVAENAKTYTFAVVDGTNPFTSVVDNNGETNGDTGINTNKYGTFYEKTKGASFTITVNAEEATEVSFIVRICSTSGYSFDYAKAITSVTSAASGVANSVTVHSGTVDTVGWYTDTASAIEIATISLAKGVNTITFTMGTETAKDLNIASVELISFVPVALALTN